MPNIYTRNPAFVPTFYSNQNIWNAWRNALTCLISYLFIYPVASGQPLPHTLCTDFEEVHWRNESNPFVNSGFTTECDTKHHRWNWGDFFFRTRLGSDSALCLRLLACLLWRWSQGSGWVRLLPGYQAASWPFGFPVCCWLHRNYWIKLTMSEFLSKLVFESWWCGHEKYQFSNAYFISETYSMNEHESEFIVFFPMQVHITVITWCLSNCTDYLTRCIAEKSPTHNLIG